MHQLDKENEQSSSNIVNELLKKPNTPLILKRLTKIEEVPHVRLLHSKLYNSLGYQCFESYKPLSLIIRHKNASDESP